MKHITIPKSLEIAEAYDEWLDNGEYSYAGPFARSGLTSVTIESGMTIIPDNLFRYADSLEDVPVPNSVTTIGSSCFENCKTLSSITIPDSVTWIKARVFRDSGLDYICLPDTLVKLGDNVFNGCESLGKVTLPKSIDIIPAGTFQNCIALKEIVLPDTVTAIQKNAFNGCISLENMAFPESLTAIGENGFRDNEALSSIVWNEVLNTIGRFAFCNCDSLELVQLPLQVKSIGESAFYDCDLLKKATVPDSVTTIGKAVFMNCDVLADVTFGTGLKTIPTQCCFECPALTSVSIPYRVTTIENQAFGNCTGLRSATILRNTNTISSNAFNYPDKLTIYGVSGTYAETYAGEIGATFTPINIPATNVALNETSIRLARNATAQLIPSITPTNFTDATAWKTSDANVVTVTEDGLVKAVGIGEATVSFVVGNLRTTCKVIVVQPVTSVSLNKTSLSLDAGDTFKLNATASPNNAENKGIEWSTSDESIASVDESGLVTALKKGTATITATAKDGGGASRSCAVTVLNTLIPVSSAEEMQSAHPYDVNANDIWQYSLSGAESLSVTFSEETSVEEGSDYIIIFSGDGTQIGKYTGEQLAGKTINVPGNVVKIQLTSDDTYCEYGFAVTKIAPVGSAHVHSYTDKITPPSCETQGYTTHTCACGDSFVDSYVPALGHSWDSGTVTLAPTETTAGIKEFTCTRCSETRTEVIPATSHVHNYSAQIVAPTCTNQGYTLHTCSGCGDSYRDNEVAALGHAWDNGTVTKQPTETQNGIKTYTCARCGETRTEAIPATSHVHNYDVQIIAPTCTGQGYTLHTCAGCGDSYKDSYTTPLEHNYVDGVCTRCGAKDPNATPVGPSPSFTDVKADAYYASPVAWAVEKKITNGTSSTTFSPDATCTRGQVVTFLWRASGSPEPTRADNPFTDVKSDAYYYKAVLWAVENGITSGTSKTTFSPNSGCTRGQVVTFQWRANGQPEPKAGTNPFTDVKSDAYYYKAVLWAVENGITNGTSPDKFSPDKTCTRGQIVTFLYRDMK